MESMALLNKGARDVMVNLPVNACTDITGFGLLGHLKEMIRGTEVSVLLDRASIPVFTGAFDYMQAGMVPGGTKNNLDFVADSVEWDDRIDERSRLILCDAQTSGGLLIALPEQFTSTFKENLKQLHGLDSFVIARVIKGQGKIFVQ
jgi:selenide,water dikinase